VNRTEVVFLTRETFIPNTFTIEAAIALILYTVFAVTVIIECLGWGKIPPILSDVIKLASGFFFGRATTKSEAKLRSRRAFEKGFRAAQL